MKEFQQRVLEEKQELDARASKLDQFFATPTFKELDQAEQDRLYAQIAAMHKYGQILAERIANFLPGDGTAGDRTLK